MGFIVGIEGVRKIGYRRVQGQIPPANDFTVQEIPEDKRKTREPKAPSDSSTDEPEYDIVFDVDSENRIVKGDERNWIYQRWDGARWMNQGYYGTLNNALPSVVRKYLGNNSGARVNLENAAEAFEACTNKLIGALMKRAKKVA
jgi:hypothetical protein